ncbi:MAG: site-specific integrase [Spirochaetes bacterium]|nr:site-specific integrase [Spirochaetota bacterium]
MKRLYRADSKMTVTELVEYYLHEYADPELGNVRWSTYREVERRLHKHLSPSLLGKVRLCDLQKSDITQYSNEVKRNYENAMQRALHEDLKRILNYAKNEEIISRYPPFSIPKREQKERPVIQEERLMEMILDMDIENAAIFALQGLAGLRIGETFALLKSDIDFEQRGVNIIKRQYKGRIENYTKTEESYGFLPARNEVFWFCNRQIKARPDSVYLFPGRTGAKSYDGWESYHWPKLRKKYKLPRDFTPHCLRHTFGYIMIKQNANIKAVQKLMRHRDIKTTLNEYGHYLDEDLRVLLDEMSKTMSNFNCEVLPFKEISGVS